MAGWTCSTTLTGAVHQALMMAEVEKWTSNMDYLCQGGFFETPGYAKHALTSLKNLRLFQQVKEDGRPKCFGGEPDVVHNRLKEDALIRARVWGLTSAPPPATTTCRRRKTSN